MIQLLTENDIHKLFQTFSGPPYNKPLNLFEEYFREQQEGLREVYLSILNGKMIGYLTLVWDSPYPAFSEAGIPEIKDLNVLVEHRRQGHGTNLIKYVEHRVRAKGYHTIGIGAGITPDYDAAKSLYPSLGYMPDGHGVHPDEWGGATYFIKKL